MPSGAIQSDAFPVEWDDPADAERSWRFDPMHAPDVTTPLSFDLYYEPFVSGFGRGTPRTTRLRQANYYVYLSSEQQSSPGDAPPETPPPDEMLADLASAGARWRNEILPEVLGYIEYYRNTDFDAMSGAELAAELDKLRATRTRHGQLHHLAVMPWMLATNLLVETYHELTGGDDISAVRLVQGYGNKSVEAGHELWRLSKRAASVPSVRDRLLTATSESAVRLLNELEGEPEARPFLDALSSYLDDYGWRSDLFELAQPTWAEDPTTPLWQLRAYLEMDSYDPAEELRKLGEERDAAVRKTLESLEPSGRSRLKAVLDVAGELASIQEDHNFYIDQRLAFMPRRLVLAAGRRLTSEGTLDESADIFYLHRDEVIPALNGTSDSLRELVADRKADMARWGQVTPPPFIGAPPSPAGDGDSPMGRAIQRFFGNSDLRADHPNVLPGNAGSAGVARGPARVLMNLGEADRLKRGDVLVARTTMPAWTPLFAVASAIVVETGGILSHTAVTAREYGVPAVLGVAGATGTLRDGQLLEVDGNKGTVRILG